jgi:hypothetical protein
MGFILIVYPFDILLSKDKPPESHDPNIQNRASAGRFGLYFIQASWWGLSSLTFVRKPGFQMESALCVTLLNSNVLEVAVIHDFYSNLHCCVIFLTRGEFGPHPPLEGSPRLTTKRGGFRYQGRGMAFYGARNRQ